MNTVYQPKYALGTLTYIMYGKFWCDVDFKLFETERQRGAPLVPVAFTKEGFFFSRQDVACRAGVILGERRLWSPTNGVPDWCG